MSKNLHTQHNYESHNADMSGYEDDIEAWKGVADIYGAVHKKFAEVFAAGGQDDAALGHKDTHGTEIIKLYRVYITQGDFTYMLLAKKNSSAAQDDTIDMEHWALSIENATLFNKKPQGEPLVYGKAFIHVNNSEDSGLELHYMPGDVFWQRDPTILHDFAQSIRDSSILSFSERRAQEDALIQ